MQYPQLDLENAKGPKALIQTNHGDIKIQLFEKEAPILIFNGDILYLLGRQETSSSLRQHLLTIILQVC